MFIEYLFGGDEFVVVVLWCVGSVYIDVVDLCGCDIGFVYCFFYFQYGVVVFGVGFCEVIGICCLFVVYDFGVNFCFVCFGVFEFFDNEGIGVFIYDEFVVVYVKWM